MATDSTVPCSLASVIIALWRFCRYLLDFIFLRFWEFKVSHCCFCMKNGKIWAMNEAGSRDEKLRDRVIFSASGEEKKNFSSHVRTSNPVLTNLWIETNSVFTKGLCNIYITLLPFGVLQQRLKTGPECNVWLQSI
jgi:hypothetical protein